MDPKTKALVLLSGGLDSAVNLYLAAEKYDEVFALNFDYGQNAAAQEKQAALNLAKKVGASFHFLDLKWLGELSSSALTSSEQAVPVGEEVQIDNLQSSLDAAQAVWVPNRNGLFINVAASFCEARNISTIIVGFNLEEAQTFPDNSADFVQALNKSLSFSTLNRVEVQSFTLNMDKKEIWKSAHTLGLKPEELWSCYLSGPSPCGKCESCQRFKRGLDSVSQS